MRLEDEEVKGTRVYKDRAGVKHTSVLEEIPEKEVDNCHKCAFNPDDVPIGDCNNIGDFCIEAIPKGKAIYFKVL